VNKVATKLRLEDTYKRDMIKCSIHPEHENAKPKTMIEAQFMAFRFPITLDQLAIEKIFGNATCVHSPHVAEPPEASLDEKSVEAAHVGSFKLLCIGDTLLPLNLQYAPLTPLAQAVKLLFITRLCSPGLTAID
jgi:hypothetical protein